LLPWFFSWTGVALALLGIYGFGSLGISIGYHRLLTHRGLVCPRWLEYTLAVLGTCCAQDSPAIWVAIHRRHHQTSDSDADPHSPVGHVLWGYIGWLLVKQDDLYPKRLLDRYARDLMRDPFYAWLERSDNWIKVVVASWLVFFALGTMAGLAFGSDINAATQFGFSVMIWGGLVRTVLVLQITWVGNTMDHLWGYRNYDTSDNSRNNPLVALMTNGEGWHNNHHADPRSANHGHKPGEFDLSWQTIRLLMKLGLAREVVLPSTPLARAYRAAERKA
jgi:stearoyl-CoA desaturase (delta-9 desaturase)